MPSLERFFLNPQDFFSAFPSLAPQAPRKDILCFTNGCFDLLHPGHVQYLEEVRAMGHFLVLGLNSDASVRRLKGSTRPLQDERARAMVLLGLMDEDGTLREVSQDALSFSNFQRDQVMGLKLWDTPWWSSSPARPLLIKAIGEARQGRISSFDFTLTDQWDRQRHLYALDPPVAALFHQIEDDVPSIVARCFGLDGSGHAGDGLGAGGGA